MVICVQDELLADRQLSLVLHELCWLQGGMKSNVSMYVSTWDDRRVCTGSRSISANKNSLLEKSMYITLKKIYPPAKWSKKGCGTANVSSMGRLHSSSEGSEVAIIQWQKLFYVQCLFLLFLPPFFLACEGLDAKALHPGVVGDITAGAQCQGYG